MIFFWVIVFFFSFIWMAKPMILWTNLMRRKLKKLKLTKAKTHRQLVFYLEGEVEEECGSGWQNFQRGMNKESDWGTRVSYNAGEHVKTITTHLWDLYLTPFINVLSQVQMCNFTSALMLLTFFFFPSFFHSEGKYWF